LFYRDEVESDLEKNGIIPNYAEVELEWGKTVNSVLEEATLKVPTNNWKQEGGRKGMHSEHLGFILAEMQYMQRSYPNMEW
jgi:ring-1,2-phenylacetyl-CoA epoxidase subunit PaaC